MGVDLSVLPSTQGCSADSNSSAKRLSRNLRVRHAVFGAIEQLVHVLVSDGTKKALSKGVVDVVVDDALQSIRPLAGFVEFVSLEFLD